jgi:hypothetical protein
VKIAGCIFCQRSMNDVASVVCFRIFRLFRGYNLSAQQSAEEQGRTTAKNANHAKATATEMIPQKRVASLNPKTVRDSKTRTAIKEDAGK